MTRSNKLNRSPLSRRALRLALCIALTSNAAWVAADDNRGANQGSAAPSDTWEMPELPAYPFPGNAPIDELKQVPAQRQSSKQAITRLLGFSAPRKQSVEHKLLPMLDQSLAMVQPPLFQPSTAPLAQTDLSTAQMMIDHPAAMAQPLATPEPVAELPKLTLPNVSMQLAVGAKPALALDTSVVVAGATRLSEPVEASMSDAAEDSDALVDDLVNSMLSSRLAETSKRQTPPLQSIPQTTPSSGFTDSIRLEMSDELQANESEPETVSMSLSDRSEPGVTEPSEQLKPSIVNTKQALTVKTLRPVDPTDGRVTDAESSSAGEPTLQRAPQTTISLAQMPIPQNPATAGLVPASGESLNRLSNNTFDSAVQNAVSSRREAKPEVSNTSSRIEPVKSNATSRPPLVPMLSMGVGKSVQQQEAKALEAVPISNPAPAAPTGPAKEHVSGREFKLAVKDSMAIQSIEPIQALSVEHEEICQVIQSGPKSFTLVGLRDGETRVAVISDVGGQRKVQVHNVVVGLPSTTATTSPTSLANEVSQTVAQLYPRSRVRITPRGTQLVVSGTVDSEDTAKKILSLVRKTTLIPVIDELQTR